MKGSSRGCYPVKKAWVESRRGEPFLSNAGNNPNPFKRPSFDHPPLIFLSLVQSPVFLTSIHSIRRSPFRIGRETDSFRTMWRATRATWIPKGNDLSTRSTPSFTSYTPASKMWIYFIQPFPSGTGLNYSYSRGCVRSVASEPTVRGNTRNTRTHSAFPLRRLIDESRARNDASRRVVTNPWPLRGVYTTDGKPQGISHDHHPPSASLGSRDQTNRLPIALRIIRTIGTRPFLHLAWLRTVFDSSRRFGRWRPLRGNCPNSSARIIPCSSVELWCHRSDALMDSFDKLMITAWHAWYGGKEHFHEGERDWIQVYHSCFQAVGECVCRRVVVTPTFSLGREGTRNG